MNKNMFNLSEKIILVAGGAGYLGRKVCKGLAEQGGKVVIADQALEPAEDLTAKLREHGADAMALPLDAADEDSIENVVERTTATYGKLDVLVNATFTAAGKSLQDLTAADFDRANRINLTGSFLLARAAADVMTEGGSIIFFTSMYGQVSPDPRIYHPPMLPNPIEYGVGKAGIIQMTRYLAVTWGPRSIRVNAVAPGPFPDRAKYEGREDFIERLAEKVPLGRVGHQNEMTGTVVFLASEESSYINGETINVDGGWTAW